SVRDAGLKVVLTGEGADALIERAATLLTQGHRRYSIELPATDGAGAAWLHAHGEMLSQEAADDRTVYEVRLSPRDYERFQQR
ncbi:MAG: hypothetical protein V4659_04710, partial [Pseudomonadota bacterium]